MSARTLSVLWLVAVALTVGLAYVPALSAGFIWDDDAHVTAPALRSWDGLRRIWTEVGATQQYYPLLHSVFWLEHRLWGQNPFGYHAANVAFHALAAVLLAMVLRRLAVPGALPAAMLFAVHPLHVESVAWISEQKNTLSTAFYLGAALAYLRFDAERRIRWYAFALGLFGLGLLTKTVIATLPAALLVVFWWKRGRIDVRRDVVPLLPWFALAITAGLFTAWIERTIIGAEGAAFELSLFQRLLLAGHVVWFYAAKLLWPSHLSFIYPRWNIEPGSILDWMPLVAALVLLGAITRWGSRTRGPLAAALLFGGALFPVLGFFNVYPFQYSFVADHFQYLASIPLLAGAAALIARASSRVHHPQLTLAATTGVACAALGVLTWRQAQLYRDNETLFRATVARNPDAWMAHNNLGQTLLNRRGDRAEAIRHLERAVALRPEYPEALNNLGLALTQTGRVAEGLVHLERSLRLQPQLYQTHNNLGIAFASLGRGEDALVAFQRAAALNPTLPNIHENWAKALLLLGRKAEAEQRFAIAARLRSGSSARP